MGEYIQRACFCDPKCKFEPDKPYEECKTEKEKQVFITQKRKSAKKVMDEYNERLEDFNLTARRSINNLLSYTSHVELYPINPAGGAFIDPYELEDSFKEYAKVIFIRYPQRSRVIDDDLNNCEIYSRYDIVTKKSLDYPMSLYFSTSAHVDAEVNDGNPYIMIKAYVVDSDNNLVDRPTLYKAFRNVDGFYRNFTYLIESLVYRNTHSHGYTCYISLKGQ